MWPGAPGHTLLTTARKTIDGESRRHQQKHIHTSTSIRALSNMTKQKRKIILLLFATVCDAAATATKNAHAMSVFKGEHLYQVLTLLTPAERPAAASQGDCKATEFQGSHVTLCCRCLGKSGRRTCARNQERSLCPYLTLRDGLTLVAMVASGLLKHLAQQDPVLLLRLRQLLDLVHHWRMPQIFSGAAQPLGLLDQRLLSLCLPRQLASNLRRGFA